MGTAILDNRIVIVIFLSEATPFAFKFDFMSYFLHLAFLNQPHLLPTTYIIYIMMTILTINQELYLVPGLPFHLNLT